MIKTRALYFFWKQIKVLNMKLEEYRIDHRKEEEDLEDEIGGMEDRLAEVKKDLETRMRDLEVTIDKSDGFRTPPSTASTLPLTGDSNPFSIPSAPQAMTDGGDSSSLMSVGYPKLSISDGMLTLDNSTKMLQQNTAALSDRNAIRPAPRQFGLGQGATSVGSSPLSSHSESSRSITPKTDHADADNCV